MVEMREQTSVKDEEGDGEDEEAVVEGESS